MHFQLSLMWKRWSSSSKACWMRVPACASRTFFFSKWYLCLQLDLLTEGKLSPTSKDYSNRFCCVKNSNQYSRILLENLNIIRNLDY